MVLHPHAYYTVERTLLKQNKDQAWPRAYPGDACLPKVSWLVANLFLLMPSRVTQGICKLLLFHSVFVNFVPGLSSVEN